MELNGDGLRGPGKQQRSVRTGVIPGRRQEGGHVQAQAEGKKEDMCKHRQKARRRTDASTGERQEGGQAQAQATGRK